MAAFAWNESYSVRVQQLDQQHQKLFQLINSLADAMSGGRGEAVVREIVDQLAIYTRTHFLQEEALMRQTGYPDCAAHKELHRKLMEDVERYKRDLLEGRPVNTVSLLNFLREWLVEHIRRSDKAYSAHLNSHGVR